MSFVHLHTHSEYSLLDGANRLSDLMFVLARVLNRANLDGLGGDDVYWRSERLKKQQQGE